ncbi:RluA family pseudouridine synthase [Prosthecomicrobium sp. N25]|uniref:RluA family pseudouridine synthase n=1 Tax=Prosthecomicrobium sp. N25 TaxID=3129254 RepID=UPI0030787410
MRLDRYIRIHWPQLAFGAVSNALRRGRITVDGRRAKPTDRLGADQVVRLGGLGGESARLRAAPSAGGEAAAEPSPTDRAFLDSILVYRDDELLVFDKPAGLAVHAGTRTTRHLEGLLAAYADPEHGRPRLVHRLDKDTSGLIVAARRREIAAQLGRAFAARDVTKEYRAVVAGVPSPGTGTIELPLAKVETAAGGRVVAGHRPEASPALTRYAVLSASPDGARSLVALRPETGRQHQLRVHMAAIGHAILGDRLYGGAAAQRADRLLLHAARLTFRHPRGGTLDLSAPVPAVFDVAD